MPLNNPTMITCLQNLIQKNQNLEEFNISDSQISLLNFQELINSLAEVDNVKTLNFAGLNSFKRSNIDKSENLSEYELYRRYYNFKSEKKEILDAVIQRLCDIILKSINLRHLDVSRLGLEEKIINIAQAARGSIGLLSIHFSENELTNSQIQKVFVELGVDAPNFVFGRQHKFADENKDGPDW